MDNLRAIISWALIIGVLCLIAWMANASLDKLEKGKAREEKLSDLPQLKLFTLDSLAFDIEQLAGNPIVLIHFNSTCEHCQYEASVINESLEKFQEAKLIFFSSEAITPIYQFMSDYGLDKYANIHFVKTNFSDVAEVMGSLSIPHIFIYGPDGKLRKEFKGETKPEAILKYVH